MSLIKLNENITYKIKNKKINNRSKTTGGKINGKTFCETENDLV